MFLGASGRPPSFENAPRRLDVSTLVEVASMEANLALPAALISDPVRAAILSALCDGRAQPAAALACAARVSPQCASNYLAPTAERGPYSRVDFRAKPRFTVPRFHDRAASGRRVLDLLGVAGQTSLVPLGLPTQRSDRCRSRRGMC